MARCNWCYKEGHNVKTCAQKREAYRRRAQDEINAGIGHLDGYAQREWAKLTKTWLHDGSDASEATDRNGYKIQPPAKKSRCSYCNMPDHNRKTCNDLKTDKVNWIREATIARRGVYNWMKEVGYGLGTIITRDRHWELNDNWLIVGIFWNLIDHQTVRSCSYAPFQIIRIGTWRDRYNNTMIGIPQIPAHFFEGDAHQFSPDRAKIIGPCKSHINPPPGWFEGADIDLDKTFEDKKSANWSEY